MPGSFPQQLIPLESLSEYDVQEILPDGREILEKPLTPAEHFQQILNRIDFTKSYDDDSVPEETEAKGKALERTTSSMWSSLREAIRMALTEIRAFVDILAVIKEEKYLSLFPISNDPPELNLPLLFSGKKRALASAADILLKGAERLRRRHSELADARLRASSSTSNDRSRNSFPSNNFHKTLMQLRQEWRLKLHQNSVLGDVSLRSIGSRFRESGTFEIRESDLVSGNSRTEVEADGGIEVVFARSVEALLNSAVEPNLVVCFLETGIDSGPISLWDHVLKPEPQVPSTSSGVAVNDNCLSQRERLVKTQRLLACREIFFTLASESCGVSTQWGVPSPDCVSFATQDQVITNIFPGVQVIFGLQSKPSVSEDVDHQTNECKPEIPPRTANVQTSSAPSSLPSKPIRRVFSLSLQLHRMLAAQHRAAWSNLASPPQCASGPVQVAARHRAAGAHALPVSHFIRNIEPDVSGFSIAVAGVAGFAGPAAAAWSSLNFTNRSRSSESTTHINQRLAPVSITQDRLALFTEWGSLPCGSQPTSLPTGGLLSVPNPFDDSVQGTAAVASVEHMLSRKKADDDAIQSVIGSTASLLDKAIAVCKHYFLREKVSELLADFVHTTPVRMTVHWDALNSAVLSSARISFHAVNYDAYRLWLGLTVSHTGVTVFYPDPPRSSYLGTDLLRLRHALTNQVMHTQIHALDLLITKILGWSQLGSNSSSGICSLDEANEGPTLVKMFASPSGKNFVCIRAGSSSGLRLFVSTPTTSESSDNQRIVTDFDQFHPINNHFREVCLSNVRSGPHDVARIEAVMTTLS